ncbi:MAG: DUF1549 and DUF1553 domain-containing protein [Pirellulaceae bacterium]
MRDQQRLACVLCWILSGSLLLASLAPALLSGAEGGTALGDVVAISVFPPALQLRGAFAYGQIVVTGKLATGESVDLTRDVQWSSPNRVSISARGLVRPRADGTEELTCEFGSHRGRLQVEVTGASTPPAVDFQRDVQPALSRMGCNQGTCHGAKEGKAGFKLSLRGYDAQFDHTALTDDIGARRTNRAAPEQSLILLKATGSIPHVGGVRTRVGEPHYELLRTWIASGARFLRESPRVTSLQVYPENPLLPRADLQQQIAVLATYSDGSVRDVTQEAFVESGNLEVVEAQDGALLTVLRRGEAPVLVRYEGVYAATTLTVMGERSGFVWQDPPEHNYVDRHVYEKLRRMKILPSGLCTDEEFVRRVYLDLTGLPPTAEQVRQFLSRPGDNRARREQLVDELVGSAEFIEHWTNKWADMLQVNRKFLGEEGAAALRNWIQQSLAENKPYDQFAYEILTASGSNVDNPPAAYFKVLRDAATVMENTTHLFLAVRFNCNKCHDHPFERWTQDQYYHLAAYFAQIGRKEDAAYAGQRIGGSAVEGAAPLVEVIYDTGNGEVRHERTGQIAAPAFPYVHADPIDTRVSRREQAARWITSARNPQFAASYVNRLWGYLFGVGLIEPIDDIRAGNPPTNPALLRALADDFIAHDFDVQHMFRVLCQSRVYQHSIATNSWNEDDSLNYSHALPRRLPAEVLYDAIHLATGSRQHFRGLPEGMRAAELPDAGLSDPFLDDFGRPVRESACECERSTGMVLGPVMKLVNGPTVAEALADPRSELAELVASETDDRRLIDEIFLRFLARRPTDAEVQLAVDSMQQAGSERTQLHAQLAGHLQVLAARQADWERTQAGQSEWVPLVPVELRSRAGATFQKADDHTVLVSGTNGNDVYTFIAPTRVTAITGLRVEALADASLPAGGPGRAANGNFVLNEIRLSSAPSRAPDRLQAVPLRNPSADFSQDGWSVTGAIDGQGGSGWAIMPAVNRNHMAVFETVSDISGDDGGSVLTVELDQHYPDGTHSLGKFRISVTTSPRPVGVSHLPAQLATALTTPIERRTPEQAQQLAAHFQSLDPELTRLRAAVAQAEQQFQNRRLTGAQDLAWALINSPAFLFNR